MKKLINHLQSSLNHWLQAAATTALVLLSRVQTVIQWLPANVSPLGSFGFFGQPAWFFLSIIIFDWLIGGFYANAWVTYLAFVAYPLYGHWAQNQTKKQLYLLPLASFSFFLISNLGVWWYWYEHTWSGLISCYGLALPFYSHTLIGDLVFGYGYLALKTSLTAKDRSHLHTGESVSL